MGSMIGGQAASSGSQLLGNLINQYGALKQQKEQAGIDRDLMDQQFENMKAMFPFSNQISENAMNLYNDNWGAVEDYLENPMPPSNLERQLFEFFGGTVPQKGYGRQPGVSQREAVQNRLLGRHGAQESGPLAGLGVGMLEDATGLLQSLIPYGQELGESGFRTDIGPIQDYALRMFEREMVPTVAERFGSNITGSGFQGEMGRTMGDVSSELGSMQVMLDEAAANRRLQGLQSGTVQNLFTAPLNLNTAFATAGAQAGQHYVDRVNAARPGAGLLNALPMFAQIDQGQGFIQQGFPTGGTDSGNLMSALGQTAGSAAGGAGDLFSSIMGMFGNNGGSGTQTGMGWNMPSTATDLGTNMPWLNQGASAGAPVSNASMGNLFA